MIIAVDGPASSGKGTVAKKLAEHFNLPYLNTGALYRIVGYKALQSNVDLDSTKELKEIAKDIESEDFERIQSEQKSCSSTQPTCHLW